MEGFCVSVYVAGRVLGRVSWLDSNSTPLKPLWLGSWIKLEIVASTKLESCLVVFGFMHFKIPESSKK